MKKLVFVLLIMCVFVSQGYADQNLVEKVKQFDVVKNFLASTGTELRDVREMSGLYELMVEQNKMKNIIYLTKDGLYLIPVLLDKDRRNIAQERWNELNKVDFSQINLSEAIVIKKGTGAKKLVMITDVDCPYCRTAHTWLKEQTDYTLYVFLLALPSHPEAHDKSVKVFCSKDQAASLDLAKTDKEIPAQKCDNGEKRLQRHKELADKVGISGTPAFITEKGDRITGFNQKALVEYLKK